jgi:hypothetical protein
MERFSSRLRASRVVHWLLAFLLAGVLSALFLVGALSAVAAAYLREHPIAATEEDLGYGLVMVGALVGMAPVALLAWACMTWIGKRFIARLLS